MNILLTNDDGVHALGIVCLAQELSKFHHVTIVAPSGERSASSHSITMNLPIFAKKIVLAGLENVITYSISGTPADCVKLGIREIMQKKVDLIVSGINLGSNLGADIFCSGTASAAIEAAVLGYKGIAVSLEMIDMNSLDFLPDAARCTRMFLSQIDIQRDIQQTLNINIPSLPITEIKGFKVARQGTMQYDEQYEKRSNPRGREYYWLTGEFIKDESKDQTDSKLLHEGYISVTPLKCDLTDYNSIESSKCKFEHLKLH